jgi:hypothetical protein
MCRRSRGGGHAKAIRPAKSEKSVRFHENVAPTLLLKVVASLHEKSGGRSAAPTVSNLKWFRSPLGTPVAEVGEGGHLVVGILDVDQAAAFTELRSIPATAGTLRVPVVVLVGPTPEDEPLTPHFPAPATESPVLRAGRRAAVEARSGSTVGLRPTYKCLGRAACEAPSTASACGLLAGRWVSR